MKDIVEIISGSKSMQEVAERLYNSGFKQGYIEGVKRTVEMFEQYVPQTTQRLALRDKFKEELGYNPYQE